MAPYWCTCLLWGICVLILTCIKDIDAAQCSVTKNKYAYCHYGCCGELNKYVPCCEENSSSSSIPSSTSIAIIVSIVTTACLVIITMLVVCCCVCKKRLKKRYLARNATIKYTPDGNLLPVISGFPLTPVFPQGLGSPTRSVTPQECTAPIPNEPEDLPPTYSSLFSVRY